jgi:hypothetical protein
MEKKGGGEGENRRSRMAGFRLLSRLVANGGISLGPVKKYSGFIKRKRGRLGQVLLEWKMEGLADKKENNGWRYGGEKRNRVS